MYTKLASVFFLFLFAGVSHAANYGSDMPAGEAVDIAVASKNVEGYASGPAKFKGRITQVCQKEGCWLMIESNGQAARIKTKDHAFVIPKDSTGDVVVFGELKQVELKPEAAKHLAEDAGQSKPVASSELQIIATSVSIK